MANRLTKKQLNKFQDAAESLKRYRRAELVNEATGASLIEELYVDPLPNNHIFQTLLNPNTTFLIGRKGTGKSTIFQRVQHELRKRPNHTSAYIDIKTVYESSRADPVLIAKINANSDTLSKDSFEKLHLYRAFLRTIIKEIHQELRKRVESTPLLRIKRFFSGTIDELFEDLDALLEDIDKNHYSNMTGIRTVTVHETRGLSSEVDAEGTSSISLSPNPALTASLTAKDSEKTSSGREETYAEILILEFNIKGFLLRLKELLNHISIRHLYIFIDDFSELPEDAMKVVVDSLLAPLNNWSEELIKFKIAAYPSRIYYGAIDNSKIDEINLDFYKLYGAREKAVMEGKAIDFTRRLIENRINYFCKCEASVFIEPKNDDIWHIFFYATMANPRNLGYILFYLYESHLIHDRLINSAAVKEAARKYYEEIIESFFTMNKYLLESYSERSSVLSLRELFENLTNRAKELRYHKNQEKNRGIRKSAVPTSHFYIVPEFESVLSTLELNFFITKYLELSDRGGRKVSVFALNYGLCQKLNIEFGRPEGTDFRNYFVERIFDYTSILENYMTSNQEIKCDHCGSVFGQNELAILKRYRMKCPECSVGTCQVTNLSKKYKPLLSSFDQALVLPQIELGILQTLRTEKRPMLAKEIAATVDCTYQLVGKRGKSLAERELVEKIENKGQRWLKLTKKAQEKYFSNDEADALNY
ncbi:MAG TPA: hypothetical protein VEP90_20980 [Methylomirabilota bacterium]|nr:hypothetical protein [Methylomirabilota bacterium]